MDKHQVSNILYKRVDNSQLIVFRIVFGLLLAIQVIGEMMTSKIQYVFIDPDFTFNFIGFDFVQPLSGNGMYIYFTIMAILGIFIMIGYKYRFSMILYTFLWLGLYLMQKSSYNNHYYLLLLICSIMCFLPAHRFCSVDANMKKSLKRISMPQWIVIIFIAQVWIVYTFAAVAKIYPDWLDGTVIKLLMKGKKDIFFGGILQNEFAHFFISYGGLLFDLFIIPLLFYKRTRVFVFIIAIFFHLFNSIVFKIGIFPYLSIALIVFFFPKRIVHRLFLKSKEFYDKKEILVPNKHAPITVTLICYILIQLALPMRHWFIQGNVLNTEEGHRLSWRMMLRIKSGTIKYIIVDLDSKEKIVVDPFLKLTHSQYQTLPTRPDLIWQYAKRLQKDYSKKLSNFAIYVECHLSVNGRPYEKFVDSNLDFTKVKWNYWGHNQWILLN